jgi:cytochrome c peroxidase
VEMTYPYFHDGAANTLTEAVDVMGVTVRPLPSFRVNRSQAAAA